MILNKVWDEIFKLIILLKLCDKVKKWVGYWLLILLILM